MPEFPDKPQLKDLQEYIREMVKERGWDKNSFQDIFLLFSEEVGELAKAMRDASGMYKDKKKLKKIELEEEFADVLMYLIDLANYFDVDLEKAFREKEEVNAKREWK